MDIKTEGRFQKVKGKIRSIWGDVTDDDIEQSKGDMESLVGVIKEKTGESAERIKSRLDELERESESRE